MSLQDANGTSPPSHQILTQVLTARRLAKASSQQLVRLLKILGMNQTQVALSLDVTPSSVSMWLRSQRPIPEEYRALVEALVASMEEKLRASLRDVAYASQGREAKLFEAALGYWNAQVDYEQDILEEKLRERCQAIGRYPQQAPALPAQRKQLAKMAREVLTVLETLTEQGY